jgi:hypothetical protein
MSLGSKRGGDRSLLPLPASGERVGVRGPFDEGGLAETPPHPKFANANFDLSPHAGRGDLAHPPSQLKIIQGAEP